MGTTVLGAKSVCTRPLMTRFVKVVPAAELDAVAPSERLVATDLTRSALTRLPPPARTSRTSATVESLVAAASPAVEASAAVLVTSPVVSTGAAAMAASELLPPGGRAARATLPRAASGASPEEAPNASPATLHPAGAAAGAAGAVGVSVAVGPGVAAATGNIQAVDRPSTTKSIKANALALFRLFRSPDLSTTHSWPTYPSGLRRRASRHPARAPARLWGHARSRTVPFFTACRLLTAF